MFARETTNSENVLHSIVCFLGCVQPSVRVWVYVRSHLNKIWSEACHQYKAICCSSRPSPSSVGSYASKNNKWRRFPPVSNKNATNERNSDEMFDCWDEMMLLVLDTNVATGKWCQCDGDPEFILRLQGCGGTSCVPIIFESKERKTTLPSTNASFRHLLHTTLCVGPGKCWSKKRIDCGKSAAKALLWPLALYGGRGPQQPDHGWQQCY